jgi:hypothetical protein
MQSGQEEVAPLSSSSGPQDQQLLEEDHVTEKYMAEFGVENVQGGSYCQLELPAAVVDVLQRKLLHADNLCVQCGAADHYVADCPICVHCGRDSHTAERCYAKTHVNGRLPTDVEKAKASKQRTRERPEAAVPPTRKISKQPKQAKQQKRTNWNVCAQCGWQVLLFCSQVAFFLTFHSDTHVADNCYASKHVNGQLLFESKSSLEVRFPFHFDTLCGSYLFGQDIDMQDQDKCHWCGRYGHMSYTCYAKTHVSGCYLGRK